MYGVRVLTLIPFFRPRLLLSKMYCSLYPNIYLTADSTRYRLTASCKVDRLTPRRSYVFQVSCQQSRFHLLGNSTELDSALRY